MDVTADLDALRALARSLVHGDPDAEDLVQDAALAALDVPEVTWHPVPTHLGCDAAAAAYGEEIADVTLDIAVNGMGPDGHTASLVPGDPVLDVTDRDVAVTGAYQGRRRMTLTYPILNRSRHVLWLVTGGSKADMLVRVRDGDSTIPAGRVRQEQALVLADEAAAARLWQVSADLVGLTAIASTRRPPPAAPAI